MRPVARLHPHRPQHWQLEEGANHAGNFPPNYRGFMEVLAANGYSTGFTGKGWGPGNPGETNGKPRQLTGPAFNRAKMQPPTPAITPNDYAANFAEFLEKRPRDQPFCFWFGGQEPHRRYQPGSGAKPEKVDRADRSRAALLAGQIIRQDMLDYAFEIESSTDISPWSGTARKIRRTQEHADRRHVRQRHAVSARKGRRTNSITCRSPSDGAGIAAGAQSRGL
jgi:hypothetical protein